MIPSAKIHPLRRRWESLLSIVLSCWHAGCCSWTRLILHVAVVVLSWGLRSLKKLCMSSMMIGWVFDSVTALHTSQGRMLVPAAGARPSSSNLVSMRKLLEIVIHGCSTATSSLWLLLLVIPSNTAVVVIVVEETVCNQLMVHCWRWVRTSNLPLLFCCGKCLLVLSYSCTGALGWLLNHSACILIIRTTPVIMI
jgi:hypothetical protein